MNDSCCVLQPGYGAPPPGYGYPPPGYGAPPPVRLSSCLTHIRRPWYRHLVCACIAARVISPPVCAPSLRWSIMGSRRVILSKRAHRARTHRPTARRPARRHRRSPTQASSTSSSRSMGRRPPRRHLKHPPPPRPRCVAVPLPSCHLSLSSQCELQQAAASLGQPFLRGIGTHSAVMVTLAD